METLSTKELATAKSNIVSPSKSPTAIENGKLPASKLFAGPNVPSPFPNSMETSSENWLATARSKKESSGGSGVVSSPSSAMTVLLLLIIHEEPLSLL